MATVLSARGDGDPRFGHARVAWSETAGVLRVVTEHPCAATLIAQPTRAWFAPPPRMMLSTAGVCYLPCVQSVQPMFLPGRDGTGAGNVVL